MTARDGIPVTTPADQAEIRELTDYPPSMPSPEPTPGIAGQRSCYGPLTVHYAGTDLTRSDLEILFKELCRTRGLPAPRVNQRVAGKEVDFLFDEARLIVETDGWRYHKTRRAFEDDRARDILTLRAGYATLRFTDRRLAREPAAVAEAIAAVLADRRAA